MSVGGRKKKRPSLATMHIGCLVYFDNDALTFGLTYMNEKVQTHSTLIATAWKRSRTHTHIHTDAHSQLLNTCLLEVGTYHFIRKSNFYSIGSNRFIRVRQTDSIGHADDDEATARLLSPSPMLSTERNEKSSNFINFLLCTQTALTKTMESQIHIYLFFKKKTLLHANFTASFGWFEIMKKTWIRSKYTWRRLHCTKHRAHTHTHIVVAVAGGVCQK